jgi:hypothetical protein
MKTISNDIPKYPFSNESTYWCSCKDPVLLRKSNLLNRTFVVSETGDQSEIIHQKHRCTRTRGNKSK